MPVPIPAPDKLAELRALVAATDRRPGRVASFGIRPVDNRLADGGLAVEALHEAAPGSTSLAADAAATLFVAGAAARFAGGTGTVLWALTRFDLYAPGLAQAGLAADRVMYAQARDDAEALALAEDGLAHGGLAAVVVEASRVGMIATRRLHLAAEKGGTPVLLLRRWRRRDSCPLSEPSAATTRWRVGSAPSPPLAVPGLGRARWSVELVRQRNGPSFSLILDACDAEGRLALPAGVADRAAAAGGAAARAA